MSTEYGLTSSGPNIKRLDVILEEMHAYMTSALGVNTAQNQESLLNHLLTNIADRLAELWEFGESVYYSQYPSSAEGTNLENAVQYGGITRESAARSGYYILCTGDDGAAIESGALIASDTSPQTNLTLLSDAEITRSAFNKAVVIFTTATTLDTLSVELDGDLYTVSYDETLSYGENLQALADAVTDENFTITVDTDAATMTVESTVETDSHVMVLSENLTTSEVGSVIMFYTVDYGDIYLPAGIVTKIVKAVTGLTSVVNVGSYIAGQEEETDAELRLSYIDKIYNRSTSMLESIRSAILTNVQGVESVAPYENPTDDYDDYGRPPHSIEIVVEGGDDTEIAEQILATKAGGINTFGDEEVVISGDYGEDITIRFNRPEKVYVWIAVGVTLSENKNVPTNYVELLEEQILEYFDGLDAGDSVVPYKFGIDVTGIDYVDIWLYATTDSGETPDSDLYTERRVTLEARQIAVTDEGRIGVTIDG